MDYVHFSATVHLVHQRKKETIGKSWKK